MEQIVNWFMLLIIFVFDPLAIAMVIAANMAFAQIKKKEPEKFECDIPDGLEYNTPYTVEEIQEKWDTNKDGVLDKEEIKRMKKEIKKELTSEFTKTVPPKRNPDGTYVNPKQAPGWKSE